MEKSFPAAEARLKDVLAFAEEQLEGLDVSPRISMQVAVTLEELFINVAHYAYPGGVGEATLAIDRDGDTLRFALTDEGLPFDPTARDDPDISVPAEQRSIGGLGIFMVKKMMDSFSYAREGNRNVVRFSKKIM